MKHKNYYEILSVDRHASQDEIKKAYRKKLFENHPDQSNTYSSENFNKIITAYQTLSDEKKREKYDDITFSTPESKEKLIKESIKWGNLKKSKDEIVKDYNKQKSTTPPKQPVQQIMLPVYFTLQEMRVGRKFTTTIDDIDVSISIPKKSFPGKEYDFIVELQDGINSKIKVHINHKKEKNIEYRDNGDVIVIENISSNLASLGGKHKITSPTGEKLIIEIEGGIKSGSKIRLKNAGGFLENKMRGNLFIKINIKKVVFSFKAVFDK